MADPVRVTQFGRDHWSMLAYVECRVVDHGGILDRTHLRCDLRRHPAHAHEGSRGDSYPTRLAGGEIRSDHDDWDCLDDLEAAGFIASYGTGVHPWFKMTRVGRRVAAKLREHKSRGGQFADFRFCIPRRAGT